MNPDGCMTPLITTQFSSPNSNEGGKRTVMSQPPRSSLHSRIPVTRYPAGSPFFSPGPRLRTQPPPLSTSWSSLPPKSPSPSSCRHTSLPPKSPSPSSCRRTSLPPKSPSPSSCRRTSLPPKSPSPSSYRQCPVPLGNPSPSSFGRHPLPPLNTSPSAPVENRDFAIGLETQPSFPPPSPFTNSNSVTVSDNTLPPRKDHKPFDTDTIDPNTMIPQTNPESVIFDDDVMIDISEYLTESTSDANETGSTTSALKRKASEDTKPSCRPYKSFKLPPPSSGNLSSKNSLTSSVDGNQNASSVELGNVVYTANEKNKSENSNKLIQVISDPKKVKRILGNRKAAARSREKKERRIVELQDSVERLRNDKALLDNDLEQIMNEKLMLLNERKELKIRLASMEHEEQLRDVLTEQLCEELQRLKLAHEEIQNRDQFNRPNMQSQDPNMYQQQQQLDMINQFNSLMQPNLDFVGQNQGYQGLKF